MLYVFGVNVQTMCSYEHVCQEEGSINTTRISPLQTVSSVVAYHWTHVMPNVQKDLNKFIRVE
jgi:hypothetical protein